MIGRIRFLWNNQFHTAELDNELTWSCADPSIASMLNTLHGPHPDRSPADGYPGYDQLDAAAAVLGAEILSLRPVPHSHGQLVH